MLYETEYNKPPYPWRLVEDVGNGFITGFIGGSCYWFLHGIKKSSSNKRLSNAFFYCRTKAPITGASFAVWAGVSSFFDFLLLKKRKKEDQITPVLSGALTGGFLSLRRGPEMVFLSFLNGAGTSFLMENSTFFISPLVRRIQKLI